jgi:protocatechuate 3,4-dioxygenase alpha subunit
MSARSPSQTIGPFFHEALRWKDGGKVGFASPCARVVLVGRIFDGAGDPVGDALVETWQPLPEGAGAAQGASNPYGFARVETAKDGTFRIDTAMPAGDAPALDVSIFARGLLKPLRTRVYLAPRDKALGDPLIARLGDSPRLDTLIATPTAKSEYHWEVRLQGERETVFFAA